MTDADILAGLRAGDERVTQDYFYGYCRVAYHVFDRRYDLRRKPGMDFYSLAHEYYLALFRQEWRPLEDRREGVSLQTWMIGGFRFLVLDRLKEVEKEQRFTPWETFGEGRTLRFDMTDSNLQGDVRQTVEEMCDSCLGRDSGDSILLKMMLVDGFQGKEVAHHLGITPSAVSQRYHRLMERVVRPYFLRYYQPEVEEEQAFVCGISAETMGHPLYELMPELPRREAGKAFSLPRRAFWQDRITPPVVEQLAPDEIFVFGSNLAGLHGGGTARQAFLHFGARMRQGRGLCGQSYAIPTMQGGPDTIAPYVSEFIGTAMKCPRLRFLVTPIGCGLAGFSPAEIAPLFRRAIEVPNIFLPESFWQVLLG